VATGAHIGRAAAATVTAEAMNPVEHLPGG
jgi:hypothetical protein